MEHTQLLGLNFSVKENSKNLPKNIYAIKVLDYDTNKTFDLAIEHDGYCPELSSDHILSNFGEYLCNVQYKIIEDYFRLNEVEKPKSYTSICEVVTDENGELYYYSRSASK